MPVPFLAALPAISAGVGAASSILNPIFQGLQNRQNRKYQLRDRDYNNLYNSPEQQMARLKAAGLNPNLVYGSGNAVTPAVSTGSNDRQAPNFDSQPVQQALYQWQDYALKELKQNQLKEMIELAQKNTELTQQKIVDLGLKNRLNTSLFDTNVELAKQRLRGQELTNVGIDHSNKLKFQEFEIKELMKKPTLDKMLQEIEYIKARKEFIPHQIDKLHADMANIRNQIQQRNLNMKQQKMIMNDLHQGIIIRNKLMDGQKSATKAQEDLNKIRAKWMEGGLSPTFTSDLMKAVLGFGKK